MELTKFKYKFPEMEEPVNLIGDGYKSFNYRTYLLISILATCQNEEMSKLFRTPIYHLGIRDHRDLLELLYLPMKRFDHETVSDPEYEMFSFKKVYTFTYIKHYLGEIPLQNQEEVIQIQANLKKFPMLKLKKLWILAPANEFDTLPGAKAVDPIIFQEFVFDNKNWIVPLTQWI